MPESNIHHPKEARLGAEQDKTRHYHLLLFLLLFLLLLLVLFLLVLLLPHLLFLTNIAQQT